MEVKEKKPEKKCIHGIRFSKCSNCIPIGGGSELCKKEKHNFSAKRTCKGCYDEFKNKVVGSKCPEDLCPIENHNGGRKNSCKGCGTGKCEHKVLKDHCPDCNIDDKFCKNESHDEGSKGYTGKTKKTKCYSCYKIRHAEYLKNKENQIIDTEYKKTHCDDQTHNANQRLTERCFKCLPLNFCINKDHENSEKNYVIKSRCAYCTPKSQCEHKKRKDSCAICKPEKKCTHGWKYYCVTCKGKGTCVHKNIKSLCWTCSPNTTIQKKVERIIWCICNRHKPKIENNKKVKEILGCSFEDFKNYIESKMTDEMTWKNIHIDHIKPISLFNLNIEQEFMDCCHYSNLQPLHAKDNLFKRYKWNDNDEKFWNENIKGKKIFTTLLSRNYGRIYFTRNRLS